MHVVIVESPAKSKTINKYLGSDYKVLASFGHIRDLPSKDGSVEPDKDFAMHYQVPEDSARHVKAISDAVRKADSLILATDPDREGEAISWHVLEALKEKRALPEGIKVSRVVFNSITRQAVMDAMAHPREIDMSLVNAQQARRALDYLVGFSISPVLWRKLPGSRSAGRVQSVALRLICEREEEIEKFLPQEYWDIKAELSTDDGKPFFARLIALEGKKLEKFDLGNEAAANRALSLLQNGAYTVASVEKKQLRRNPAAPFTTSTLQQEAFRKLGFGAKRTMQIAQKLYEGMDIGGETVGLITYMRTDGVDVAPEAIHGARDLIGKRFGPEFVPSSPRMYQSKAANAQEAHEAIRPTDVTRTPQSVRSVLDADSFALYDLIWKRLIASQMQSAVLDQVVADLDVTAAGGEKNGVFRATGTTVNFEGFFALYSEGRDDEEDEESSRLPPLAQHDKVNLQKLQPAQHFTEPPPRYTEASLVKKLEELGIGRPSTYASIISILQERDYVSLEKKRFVPEPRGRVVTTFLSHFFRRYVEYDFTANLEEELDKISNGELEWRKVLHEFWKEFHVSVKEAGDLKPTEIIRELNAALSHYLFPGEGDVETRRKCPACAEGRLSLKMGKFGAFIGCSNYPECRHTRQLEGSPSENKEEGGANQPAVFDTRQLGAGENDEPITVRKGPYGFYVQLGEGKKPKRMALPKTLNPNDVTLEQARLLLTLPREIGKHPESGSPIIAGIGRFGPYIQHEGRYVSLKTDDVLTIGINRAVALIQEAGEKKGGRGSVKPLKTLGAHPDGGEIAVYTGRYGPYVKLGKVNATLPKGVEPDAITLEEAIELINRKSAKGGKGKKSTRKKKES
jgi:DNA topoisomerase-1